MNAMVCTPRRGVRRAGLTLIELTVVLLILVALAGILVPLLSGYVERAHGASSADGIKEIVKAWELHRVKNLSPFPGQPVAGYPNRLDSLLETGGTLYSQLPAAALSELTPLTLGAVQVESLEEAGITQVFDFRDAGDFPVAPPYAPSATFGDEVDGPYATAIGAPRTLATGGAVAQISGAVVASRLGADTAGTYVAFGVGQRCSAIGRTMADAPVHFFDKGEPNDVYARYFVVFQIPATGATAGFKARFIGVLGPELKGIGGHLEEYYGAN